jgi:hypothetical protein
VYLNKKMISIGTENFEDSNQYMGTFLTLDPARYEETGRPKPLCPLLESSVSPVWNLMLMDANIQTQPRKRLARLASSYVRLPVGTLDSINSRSLFASDYSLLLHDLYHDFSGHSAGDYVEFA